MTQFVGSDKEAHASTFAADLAPSFIDKKPTMPKNKRAKVVALTQTQKKGRERKVALAEAVRDCTDKFSHAYVMQTVNMKTTFMQTIRQDWKERGVFIHGKLKVLSLGVGISASTEPKPNMHKLAEHIGPDCLLFFTNEGPKVVAKYCEEWGESDHARSGFECTSTYVLPKGHLPQFTFTQDEMLRKLGVPVCLRLARCFPPSYSARFVYTTATSCWTKTTPSLPWVKSSPLSRLMCCDC